MSLEEVLEEVRVRLREKIKHQLSGLQGFVVKPIYNSRMPLCLEMLAGGQMFEVMFLVDGEIELKRGRSSNPDIRIESDSETLRKLLQNPSADSFKDLETRKQIRIIALTQNGRDTEAYIRHYLAT
jgi:hypothetical protein